jgi:hypothetical protein
MGSERSLASNFGTTVLVCKVWFCSYSRHRTHVKVFSVDGDVMLWDLRGADIPVKTWNIGNGLSAFSVHDQARVFAGWVHITTRY